MADKTEIHWTDATWNPLVGCSVVSPGCTNCYAMRQAGKRLASTPKYKGLTLGSKAGAVWTGEVRFWEAALDQPLRWTKPRMIFVNSMSDLFHENVPTEWIDRIWAVMRDCPQHTFQVLTKRAELMRIYATIRTPPPPNVWLGVSVEDQARADERIPLLLDTPAAVRWISAEPLLGPIDLDGHSDTNRPGVQHWDYFSMSKSRLDWVVIGGESGPEARPLKVEWARSIIAQCGEAGVPVFMKQLGAHPRVELGQLNEKVLAVHDLRLRDRKGGDPSEWPADLRVREYPEERA